MRIYELKVPAEASSLQPLRAFLTSVLEDVLVAATPMVVLALAEACANVVAHRSARLGRADIQLRLEVWPQLVRFRIGAFCCAADLPAIRPRELAEVRPGGLGTHFIARIMDRVDYEPEADPPDAMALVLEKRLAGELLP